MDLPEFNPQGTGPQGVGGIPLDAIRVRPTLPVQAENDPVAQDVIGREVDALMGLTPAPQPAQQLPPDSNPDTGVVPAPPLEAAAPAPPGADNQTTQLRDPLGMIIQKYHGSFPELAKAHSEAQQKITRLGQERSDLADVIRAEVRDAISGLQGEVAATLSRFGGQAQAPMAPQAPPVPMEAPPEVDRDQFLEDPARHTYDIVSKAVSNHLKAFAEAQVQRERQREVQQEIASRQTLIDQHRGRIQQIYSRAPRRYDSMDPVSATDTLLEMAQLEERADLGARVMSDVVQARGGMPQSQAPAAGMNPGAVPYASLVGPGGAYVTRAAGNGVAVAPTGNWSGTPAFQRLKGSRSDSIDETRAITDVLNERGFWSNRG